jgi:hypothetical protein
VGPFGALGFIERRDMGFDHSAFMAGRRRGGAIELDAITRLLTGT